MCRLALAKALNPNELFEGKALCMYNRDLDIRPYEWLIPRLACHTKVPPSRITSMLLNDWDELLHNFKRGGYPIGVVGRPHYKTPGIRVCPKCLKEDIIPYFRKIWRIGAVTACNKHRCLLVDRCPTCGAHIDPKRVRWNKPITSCHNCGFDLTEIPVHSLSIRDPFFRAVMELSHLKNAEKHKKVFKIARLLGIKSSLWDPFYQNHPLTKDPVVKKIFAGKRGKMFTNIKSSYLVIGTAWALLKDEEMLDRLLRRDHSCSDHFWTEKPFCCHRHGRNKSFNSKYNFIRHSYVHTNTRPHICPKCGQAFIQKTTMRKHMKSCSENAATFHDMKDVLKHLRGRHGSEDPYQCYYCEKTFASDSDIKDHLMSSHRKKPQGMFLILKGTKS
jgi:hypothetical protein